MYGATLTEKINSRLFVSKLVDGEGEKTIIPPRTGSRASSRDLGLKAPGKSYSIEIDQYYKKMNNLQDVSKAVGTLQGIGSIDTVRGDNEA